MSYKNWTAEEENQLKELVKTGLYSYRQIGAIMNRSIHSVTCHARQYLDINNDQYVSRKYGYTEGFFRAPTVINSYIAGFLAADGSIRRNAANTPSVRLEIHSNDEAHLLWIKTMIGHEGPLFAPKNKQTKLWEMFVSEEYVQELGKNFGVIQNKTHRLRPPALSSFDTRFAYLLGLLDGDGCVHIGKNGYLSIGYTSCSMNAVEWIRDMMIKMGFPIIKRRQEPKITKMPNANAHHLVYTGARAVCLVQLAQHFATQHNLPILARKWNNPALNAYIDQFYQKHDFLFDPIKAYELYKTQ